VRSSVSGIAALPYQTALDQSRCSTTHRDLVHMADLFENPLGLDGFEFIEFCAPEKGLLEPVFESDGLHPRRAAPFQGRATCGGRADQPDRQLRTAQPAAYFAAEHGPSRLRHGLPGADAAKAYDEAAIERGAEPVESAPGDGTALPAIRASAARSSTWSTARLGTDALSIYDIDFVYLPGVDRHSRSARASSLIDHLTHNVYGGRMAHWAPSMSGSSTSARSAISTSRANIPASLSRAMTAPDGKIRIPLNEEGKAGGGQIEEFLRQYNGEGIQHIALICDDLIGCWDRSEGAWRALHDRAARPITKMLDERLPGHGEPVAELQARGILLDGSTEDGDPRLLLQIFSQTEIGPVFFEFIQRKRR
jgi:4-hydroxyphenylpyruvate dioxygenase